MSNNRSKKLRRMKQQVKRELTSELFGTRKQKKRPKRKRDRMVVAPASKGYSYQTQTKRPYRVSGREMVGDLTNSSYGVFSVIRSLSLNPGLPGTFPWLSNIARNYERYRFHSLAFEFVPILGTTTQGKICLIPEYDAADDNDGLTEIQFASFEGYTSQSLWTKSRCNLKPSNMCGGRTSHFIRSKGLNSDLDIKTYDVGTFLVGCKGYQTNSMVGELFVSYDVTFYNPQLSTDTFAESWQFEMSNPTNVNTPFEGVGPSKTANGGLLTSIVSGTRLLVRETGKFLVKIGSESVTNLSALNAPAVVDVEGGINPTITASDSSAAPSYATFTSAFWEYIVDATEDWYFDWTGLAATAADRLTTSIVRVPSTYTEL